MAAPVLYSVALHGAVLALLLLWPAFRDVTPPRMVALIIDLVESAPASGSPASGKDAAQTADARPETAPDPARPRAEMTPASPAAKDAASSAARQNAAPSVGELLRGAEAAHRGTAAAASGTGGSGIVDAVDAGGTGAASLKDFIRVQIERRWQIDPDAPNILVTLRLMIAADGSVTSAEPLDSGGQDRVLRALAISARNAALLASPLQFPRGTFAVTGEMIVDLNTREARR